MSETAEMISPAEWEIMRIIWAHPDSQSKAIIQAATAFNDWQATTIKTLLARLVKKGWVKTQKKKNYYRYQAAISESQALAESINQLTDHTCKKNGYKLVMEVINQVDLDQAGHDQILACLEAKKLVDQVPCSCQPGQCNCHQHS
ncbi:hypothetical protein AWM75_07420 [Aerococcus urinaehominis]|uniref:Uncharacterized protein n=1 Tax=Aerococcus urinaehominis TaxID=128944 RepID=A0A0X8FNA6_9LACT|nr:BlaI/MecI/CopY family transcriptional regulator [Aerococcus urinaehominis]AMB99802.1 hypothetical protein AWM75_07420 [Aerococcus urinaehominis]SDM08498.1 copper transport repressor, CopY/TcrY family [Aerococcus urinaehominis]